MLVVKFCAFALFKIDIHFCIIIALANIALPLTNAFVGEFLMFTGIFTSVATKFNILFTVFAGLCIILAAVYTLNMIRKVFYGEATERVLQASDISLNEKLALALIVVMIIGLGVYSQPFLEMTKEASGNITNSILQRQEIIPFLKK